MKRRAFLAAAAAAHPLLGADGNSPTRRVAAVGHTGRGNFGHGLDTVWRKIPEAEVVGVADANVVGLGKELIRMRLPPDRGYTDYRKMLAETYPEFVSVCPRHADQHRDMALAAIEAGAKGIYVEKPFCRSPEEADQLIAACKKHSTKVAVAHRNRYHPALAVIDELVAKGDLGMLLEIRGRGKGDRRGGAEDLWVLGSHVVNLIHYFAGDPKSCSAVMLTEGKPVTASDIVDGAEGLGPLAGNEIHARYLMDDGVMATFDSIANDSTEGAGFGLQLVGSEGIINIQCDLDPVAHFVPGNPFQPRDKPRPWIPITSSGLGKKETQPELIKSVQNHEIAIRDLIQAVDEGRDPLCDVHQGALTVEMICAIFESHRRSGKAVEFPLKERRNPLAVWAEKQAR